MRYYSGYMTKGNRKQNFLVRANSKANAMGNLKEDYPGWKVMVVESYKKKK